MRSYQEEIVSMELHEDNEARSHDLHFPNETNNLSIAVQGSSTTLEKKFQSMTEAYTRGTTKPTKPLIQRVPILFHSHKNFKEHFEPRAVSFGPIHHRKPGLELAENIKLRFAEQFIIDSCKDKHSIYREVAKDIKDLRDCYEKEATKEYEDGDLAWMLFVDGCSMLSFIHYFINGDKFDQLNVKSDIAALWLHDMFLLENQLPFRLLKLLMRATEQEEIFHKSIQDFIVFNNIIQGKGPTPPFEESNKLRQSLDECPHLLHLLRGEFVCHRSSKHNNVKSQFPDSVRDRQSCPATNQSNLNEDAVSIDIQVKNDPHKKMQRHRRRIWCRNTHRTGEDDKPATFRSVKTLKAAGIRAHSRRSCCVTEIELKNFQFYLGANLYLSPFIVDDGTASKFLNLAAYEMCPDFFNDFAVTSYVCFLDMLIDEAEDVKILRDAEVLYNVLGSDQEVAQLFNEISTDLVLYGDDKYADVKRKIQKHYGNKGKTWVAQFYYDHFSSPWTMIAFVAAILGLGLSFVQAWSAMMTDDPCKKVCRLHSLQR